MDNLLEELKKRSIFKVAVAYILVGWILVQVAAAIESLVEMPDWFGAVVLAFIVIGFPIAMILAWAYEVTPEGIKKTSKKTKSKSKKSTEKSKTFE
ncbi:MAG: adenylyl cyclase, partial [Gammaproteobacteria bacterium]|nr:adenylyl cyclase [Gammaproteobacteria bacterium]